MARKKKVKKEPAPEPEAVEEAEVAAPVEDAQSFECGTPAEATRLGEQMRASGIKVAIRKTVVIAEPETNEDRIVEAIAGCGVISEQGTTAWPGADGP